MEISYPAWKCPKCQEKNIGTVELDAGFIDCFYCGERFKLVAKCEDCCEDGNS